MALDARGRRQCVRVEEDHEVSGAAPCAEVPSAGAPEWAAGVHDLDARLREVCASPLDPRCKRIGRGVVHDDDFVRRHRLDGQASKDQAQSRGLVATADDDARRGHGYCSRVSTVVGGGRMHAGRRTAPRLAGCRDRRDVVSLRSRTNNTTLRLPPLTHAVLCEGLSIAAPLATCDDRRTLRDRSMDAALRVVIVDATDTSAPWRTAERAAGDGADEGAQRRGEAARSRFGLTPIWRFGAAAFRIARSADAWTAARDWTEALSWAVAVSDRRHAPIESLQVWCHGGWGSVRLGRSHLDTAATRSDHALSDRLDAL